jgi:serine/threonine protein kinase
VGGRGGARERAAARRPLKSPTRRHGASPAARRPQILRLKQLEHIKSEVRLLSRLSHPFIVNLLGHCQDARRVYLLFEYVPGGELFSLLRRSSHFSPAQASFYAAEIVLALGYVHSLGVAYRDLKPENLLLDAAGHVKLADFGFAKDVGAERTFTLCGTPEYLAPEIIQSRGHDRGVDWWALGILVFEMLAGYPPFFDDAGPLAIYAKVLAGRIRFPSHFAPEARDLVRRLLTADRTLRLGCMRAGVADITAHAWFAGVSWEAAAARALPPPFVPPLRGAADTSNFDKYPESDDEPAKADAPPRDAAREAADAALFASFDDL